MRRSPLFLAASLFVVVLVAPAAHAATPRNAGGAQLFHAQSMDWLTPDDAFVMGSYHCGAATKCTTVAETTDRGRTWSVLSTLPVHMNFNDEASVTEIRFADATHGYAFEPGFLVTNNGGHTWQPEQLPGGGHLVLALDANEHFVYMIVSPCHLNDLCEEPSTMWRATPGRSNWRQVPVTLTSFVAFNWATISEHGLTAYVLVPVPASDGPDLFEATTDGHSWSARPNPCKKNQGEFLTHVTAVTDTDVDLLCQEDIGFGKAAKHAYRSQDTAQTLNDAGVLPLYGITSQLIGSVDGTLLVPTYSIGTWLYRNESGGQWTTPVDLGDGGMGWNDAQFTTNSTAYVIHGPYGLCCRGGPGEIWWTRDAGITWNRALIAPSA